MGKEILYIFVFIGFCLFLEFFFPRIRRPLKESFNFEDIIWFFVNEILIGALGIFLAFNLNTFVSQFLGNYLFVINLKSYHPAIQFILFLLVIDLSSYLFHRLLHSNPFLWNFHKLHHSLKDLNPFSAFRHSLSERIYIYITSGLSSGVVLLQDDPKLLCFLFSATVCILQHSNVKIDRLSFLEIIFITPHNHLYHHSIVNFYSKGQNFGFVFSFWDRLFRSYFVKKAVVDIGLDDDSFPEGLAKRYFYPWIKK